MTFISGAAAFYFYNQLPNKNNKPLPITLSALPSEKMEEKQEEKLELILSKYVSYNNNRDYDKSWFSISDFFKRKVIDKK